MFVRASARAVPDHLQRADAYVRLTTRRGAKGDTTMTTANRTEDDDRSTDAVLRAERSPYAAPFLRHLDVSNTEGKTAFDPSELSTTTFHFGPS